MLSFPFLQAKWIHLLLNDGHDSSTNATILPKKVIVDTMTAYIIACGKSTAPATSIDGYGMGWHRYAYRGHEIVGHSGGIPGYITDVTLWLEHGFGIVVLINDDSQYDVLKTIYTFIVERLVGLEPLGTAKKEEDK